MKRREFIGLVGGAAAWPVVARGQQAPMPVIGFLHSGKPLPRDVKKFQEGLTQVGFVEGDNVAIQSLFAEGKYQQLPTLAVELVSKRVAVIFAAGGTAPALAAMQATSSIPIVFLNGSDPVKTGLVTSLNRPTANVTGLSFVTGIVQSKALELLHQAVPQASIVGALVNRRNTTGESRREDLERAARALGIQFRVVDAGSPDDFDAAYKALIKQKVGALLLVADPLFRNNYKMLTSLAMRYSLPVMGFGREFVEGGALISYAADIADSYRQAGIYVGRILKGEQPSELPVLQPTKFELVLNLTAAKILGLKFPDKMLALADEVIE